MKLLLQQDVENIKESFRRFSCFEGKENGKMILLAFPSEISSGRYSEQLFMPYSAPEKRVLGWYNAKPALMRIFSELKNRDIYAEYDGLHKDVDPDKGDIFHLIDVTIRHIAMDILEEEIEDVVI